MHLQLSRLSGTRSLRFCIFTPSECPGVIEIVLLFHFWVHHPERTTRPSESIPSSVIVSQSWDLAVLLCEIACCILLNVRLNNDRPQLLAVVVWRTCEAPLSTSSLSYIHSAADRRPVRSSLLGGCLHLDLPAHSQRSIFLSLAVCI